MKKSLFALVVVLALFGQGMTCQTQSGKPPTAEAIAFKALDGIASTVDVAMKVWGNYVRTTQPTKEAQAPVKAAYMRYQSFALVAEDLVQKARTMPQKPGELEGATKLAQAAADDLIALIYSFTE